MNHTHDEMIAIIQAGKDGKAIQFRQYSSDEWQDTIGAPLYSFSSVFYRTKPEKKVGYVNIYNDQPWQEYLTRGEADEGAATVRISCIRFEYEEGQFDE